jgi:hypothetical protein
MQDVYEKNGVQCWSQDSFEYALPLEDLPNTLTAYSEQTPNLSHR